MIRISVAEDLTLMSFEAASNSKSYRIIGKSSSLRLSIKGSNYSINCGKISSGIAFASTKSTNAGMIICVVVFEPIKQRRKNIVGKERKSYR